jgi:hypothetical protein
LAKVPAVNGTTKERLLDVGMTVGFLSLGAAFLLNLWGRPAASPTLPVVDPKFTNTATVRLSASELIKSGEDASGLDCYACHEKNKTPHVNVDTNGNVILPKEHEELVMRHGRNNLNNQCFNCHDPEKLDQLKTKDGKRLTWDETTKLCASCHGPTYRDWEAGIHGRPAGYWNTNLGAQTKVQCASCHHPHSPAFPALNPAPGPHALHMEKTR